MKKSILILAAVFTLSSFFTSCRNEVEAESDEVEIIETDEEEVDETYESTDGDTDGDIENTLEEGVDEVKENTGTGGTDDNG